jgi:hypothetical protein
MSMVWQPPQPKPVLVAGSKGCSPIAAAMAGTTLPPMNFMTSGFTPTNLPPFIVSLGRNSLGDWYFGPWQLTQPKSAYFFAFDSWKTLAIVGAMFVFMKATFESFVVVSFQVFAGGGGGDGSAGFGGSAGFSGADAVAGGGGGVCGVGADALGAVGAAASGVPPPHAAASTDETMAIERIEVRRTFMGRTHTAIHACSATRTR